MTADAPLVSVAVMTYQHAPFIRECLDGVLSQRTDFDYEVLLGEDGSTDGTGEICRDYAERHPGRIRLFVHDRSRVVYIGGRPTGRMNLAHLEASPLPGEPARTQRGDAALMGDLG